MLDVLKKVSAMRSTGNYQKNGTVQLFKSICKILYLSSGTNFWFEDLNYPSIFMRIYKTISKILEVIVIGLIISEWGSFYTQTHLTEKQKNDMFLFAFSHVCIYLVYASTVFYKHELRELVFTLVVRLKGMYNDEQAENMMVKSIYRYLAAFVLMCSFSVVACGLDNGVQSLTSNATFTTVIPVWPDVADRRPIAGVARVLFYIVWCIFAVRTLSAYLIILAITICLAHQFKILCKYFENLDNIFDDGSDQVDKERRYVDAFKKGIKMHSISLWSTRQTQLTCGVAFSAQVFINVGVLGLLMIKMMYTERTLIALMPLAIMAASVLIGSGVFMWNAGDVTIEASRLPTAMFGSGWHNCRQSSVRARKMVTIAMMQAQRRLSIKGVGIFELSYESYVTIVKSSYSLFSVIY